MKKILLSLSILISFSLNAQTINGDRVVARNAFYLTDWWITGIQRDSLLSVDTKIPTSKSVNAFTKKMIKDSLDANTIDVNYPLDLTNSILTLPLARSDSSSRKAISLSFTTTGSSGAATFTYNNGTGVFTCNIPSYTGGGDAYLGNAQTFTQPQTIQGTVGSDGGQLGTELGTTATGTDWAGSSLVTGYTKTPGNTNALTSSFTPTATTYYRVVVTTTGTVGTGTWTFGGYSSTTMNFGSSQDVSPRATSTSAFVFTPNSTFDGTVTVTIKNITTSTTASFILMNSFGTITNEFRASAITTSQFLGRNSGIRHTTGVAVTGTGDGSLQNNTSGANNTATGLQSLFSNSIGSNNLANGSYALYSNTTGGQNSVFGDQSAYLNTTGQANTVGGYKAYYNGTSGSNNTVFGQDGARFLADGTTALVLLNNSTYIGKGTKASADNVTNENVFGYNTIGLQSNSVAIGSSAVTLTGIYGNLKLLGSTNHIILPQTVTAGGTTGAQTINKALGKVNFAAAAQTLVVTNSLVTTSSNVYVQVEGTDATAKTARVTLASGSFTITLDAAATSETRVSFRVDNGY